MKITVCRSRFTLYNDGFTTYLRGDIVQSANSFLENFAMLVTNLALLHGISFSICFFIITTKRKK